MLKTYWRLGRRVELAFTAFLFTLGAICSYFGWHYGIGELNEVGPGAIPLFLGAILMLLAVLSASETARTRIAERRLGAVVTVLIGILVWALLIERAGFAVSNFVLLGFCSLAEERLSLIGALILALALTVIGYAVFVLGFGLPLTLF